MKSKDYKCSKCGTIEEYTTEDTESFPEAIKCKRCGKDAYKIFSLAGVICWQGRVGNAKNGYTSTGGNIKKS